MSIPTTTEQTLRQYDEKIHTLIDNHMQWQVKYRSDEEVERRNEILVKKYGNITQIDSIFLKKKNLTLERVYMFSNIMMAHLLANKLMVPSIDLKLYAPVCIQSILIKKRDLDNKLLSNVDIKETIDIINDYVKNFLQESEIFSYFNPDNTPSRKLSDILDLKVKVVRRMAFFNVRLLVKEGDSIRQVGHEFVIAWEIIPMTKDNVYVNFNVIDNIFSLQYTIHDLNVDVHKIILDTMSETFRSKHKDIFTRNEILVNYLPSNKNVMENGFSLPYTCMSCARRAVLYCAILQDQSILERENALETYVPIEQIINYKKRKILSTTETRYANNLMMYVNSMNKIIEFIMTNPLIWTDRDLIAVDPQEIASMSPFPIYTIDPTPYTILTVKYYHDLKFKKYSNMPLFVHLYANNSKITLVNADSKHHDKKEFYFDLDKPTAFSTTPPALFDERPPDYCTVSTQYNKQLIHSIRHLHARLLRLELANQ